MEVDQKFLEDLKSQLLAVKTSQERIEGFLTGDKFAKVGLIEKVHNNYVAIQKIINTQYKNTGIAAGIGFVFGIVGAFIASLTGIFK